MCELGPLMRGSVVEYDRNVGIRTAAEKHKKYYYSLSNKGKTKNKTGFLKSLIPYHMQHLSQTTYFARYMMPIQSVWLIRMQCFRSNQ